MRARKKRRRIPLIFAGVFFLRPLAVCAGGGPFSPGHGINELPADLGPNPLIVVHAAQNYDRPKMAAAGIDLLIESFKAQSHPIVYLINDQTPAGYDNWYTKDRSPDYEIFSEGGEHNLPCRGDEATIVGGYFGSFDAHSGCQTLAIRDAIRMHFEASDRPFTVHLPVQALYFYEDDKGTRRSLLALDPAKSSAKKIGQVFDDFAEFFFLRDNYSEILEFSHPYRKDPKRRNKRYRDGQPVNVDGYTFQIVFNGTKISKFGHGPRKVFLNFSNAKQDPR